MNGLLFDNTKMAAYFLWEYTGCDNALNLWFCAEEIACFLEQMNVLDPLHISAITRLDKTDPGYIHFMRHISFRIFIFTYNPNDLTNWFVSERLLTNNEWTNAITAMAAIYRHEKTNRAVMNDVRSENVRAYYDEQTLHTL